MRGDHPTENSFNRLAHEQLDGVLQAAASEHARGRLVDIGCGLKPYARMFAPFVEEHVGVDHPESPHALTSVDVLATAYDIPLEAETFDTVLMTEVLEHLETPDAALAEAERLLRRGGKIILTTPFIWVLHEEPRDFFRYTPHGLRYLLENAGFADVNVRPISGQWATLGLLTGYALRKRWPGKRRIEPALELLTRGIHRLAVRLDEAKFDPWMSWDHLAVATKPPAPEPD